MRKLVLVLAALLTLASTASAQPIVIHGAPQGVQVYNSPADWPWTTGQCHWKTSDAHVNPVGPLVPGLSHLHIEAYPPIWGELGPGEVTVPVTLRLFQTAGRINIFDAHFMTPYGAIPVTIVTVDTPLPLVGNPAVGALVSVTAHVTFDPSLANITWIDDIGEPQSARAISSHGWFNLRIRARTDYDNGEPLTDEFWVPFWSVLDPSAPVDTSIPEGTQEFAAKCEVAGNSDTISGVWGIHLTEFRTLAFNDGVGYSPILAPFNTPQIVRPLTYSYGNGGILPPSTYELRLDGNFHMGVAGTLLASTQTEVTGGVTNVDTLDPTLIAASTAQMGTTPGKHRLLYMWNGETGPTGSEGTGPNERLVSMVGEEVTIGPNPIGPPPPLLCTDPGATNVGLPLPCVFAPPPPPPPTWVTIPGLFQQFGTTTQFQFCSLLGTNCVPVSK